jgi:hypothetical protein
MVSAVANREDNNTSSTPRISSSIEIYFLCSKIIVIKTTLIKYILKNINIYVT